MKAWAIDEPLEYARLYLEGNMKMWIDTAASAGMRGIGGPSVCDILLFYLLYFLQGRNPRRINAICAMGIFGFQTPRIWASCLLKIYVILPILLQRALANANFTRVLH